MATTQAKKLTKLARLEALKTLEVQKEQQYLVRTGLVPELPHAAPKANASPLPVRPTVMPQSRGGYSNPQPTPIVKAPDLEKVPATVAASVPLHGSGCYPNDRGLDADRLDWAKEVAEAKAALALQRERSSSVWERIAKGELSQETPLHSVASSSSSSAHVSLGPESNDKLFARIHNFRDWNFLELPVLEFRVLSTVFVREGPGEGTVSGRLLEDQIVKASEETFDGWMKLVDQPGWAPSILHEPRGSSGREADKELVEPLGARDLMAVPELSTGGPRQRMFEVVATRCVHVFQDPTPDADIRGVHYCGEFVLAETQSYHGWIRVADARGWMLTSTASDGQLLRAVSAKEHGEPLLALPAPEEDEETREKAIKKEEMLQQEAALLKQLDDDERRQALEELEIAAKAGDPPAFYIALKFARQCHVSKKDIAKMHALFSMR